MLKEKFTSLERRAVFSLAAIMSLRLLGLFMILPVFALYAHDLQGKTPFLIGLALGIYGLTQALFQIPFGMLSDRFGRKSLITLGLIIFVLGSVIAALSHSITGVIIGRALQGAGAIGSSVTAMIADLTRESQRTKAMAINGICIGMTFSLAMMLGPLFAAWVHVTGIFWLASVLGLLGILLLHARVPTPAHTQWHADTEMALPHFFKIFSHPQLARFNASVFILHAIFTATFIALPLSFNLNNGFNNTQQWKLFLPALLLSFVISMSCIAIAERKRQFKVFFIAGILLLMMSELIWHTWMMSTWLAAIGLLLFFSAFTLLEAFLPSLVSRVAPSMRKGTAMGIFSCAQFFGIFFGGTLGGWIYGHYHFAGVYLFCLLLTVGWLLIAFGIKNPQYSTSSTHEPISDNI